jgi:hypothetical protein
MDRRLALVGAALTLAFGVAACQPVDGGAGGSDSPSPQASAAESGVTAPTDAPMATPGATTGTDYSY